MGGGGESTNRLLVSQSGKRVQLSLSLPFVCNQQMETARPSLRPNMGHTPPPSASTSPGGWAPVQMARQGLVHQPPRGRAAIARGKGQRLGDPALVLLPPGVQPLTAVPSHWPAHWRLFTCAKQRFQPRIRGPRDSAPYSLTHAQYLPPLATLPLSSLHPCLSWAVRLSTPRLHLKSQEYAVSTGT